MKNIYLSFVFLMISFFANAQATEQWKSSFESNILWQKVTNIGNLIVATQDALYSINPDDGTTVWKKEEFKNLNQASFKPIENSPLVSINHMGTISFLEPLRGTIIFDSKSTGINRIISKNFFYKSNQILISGEDSSKNKVIAMVNMSDGEILWTKKWTKKDRFGHLINALEIEKDILMVTTWYTYRINKETGEVVWKEFSTPETEKALKDIERLGKLGSLLLEMSNSRIEKETAEVNLRIYLHPSKEAFYVAYEDDSSSSTSTTSSGTTVTYKLSISAHKMSDGSFLWKKPFSIKGSFGDITFYKDNLLVLPNNGRRTKINLVDHQTGIGKWGKKGKGLVIRGGVYDFAKTEAGMSITTSAKNGTKNYLDFLDLDLGQMTYEKPAKIKGKVVNTEKLEKGTLFLTTDELSIINTKTGALVLDEDITTRPEMVVQKENLLYIFDTKSAVLKILDKKSGTIKNLNKVALKFKGGEKPERIELIEDGILLKSPQNLALYDWGGSLKYQEYFKAPSRPGIVKAFKVALSVAYAYDAARFSYAGAALTEGVKQERATNKNLTEMDNAFLEMYDGLGNEFSRFGKELSNASEKAFKQAFERFKATKSGKDFVMVLTIDERVNYLAKVNKANGKVTNRLNLGKKEQIPEYAVDIITSKIFLKTDDKTVTTYTF